MKTIDLKSFLIGTLFTLLVIVSLGAQEAQPNDKETAIPAFQIAAGDGYAYIMRTSDGTTWASFQGNRLRKVGTPE